MECSKCNKGVQLLESMDDKDKEVLFFKCTSCHNSDRVTQKKPYYVSLSFTCIIWGGILSNIAVQIQALYKNGVAIEKKPTVVTANCSVVRTHRVYGDVLYLVVLRLNVLGKLSTPAAVASIVDDFYVSNPENLRVRDIEFSVLSSKDMEKHRETMTKLAKELLS